jgi:predicted glycoside hydrolase/deacetylase ChbG (UPF0249 family)
MGQLARSGAILAALCLASAAAAADFSDPTWPCIQRKVETLSPGLMWPSPVEDTAFDAETEAAVADLAGRMALRRVSLEELETQVAAFTAAQGRDPSLLGHVFMTAFDALAAQRHRIMKGIEEYSLKQIKLAERIDTARTEMDNLMAADAPDYDRVDALEEQIAWDERIYTDRQKSLTYVCETPVLLEKRLYAIAQMLQDAMRE